MNIQISEIFTTELFLNGVFDDLPPDRLFGVLAGMCTTLNKRVEVHTTKADRRVGWGVGKIRNSPIVMAADALNRSETTWDARLIGLGTMWAKGRTSRRSWLTSTARPTSPVTSSAPWRARELAGQLKHLWAHDEMKTAEIKRLMRDVSRDEVAVVG